MLDIPFLIMYVIKRNKMSEKQEWTDDLDTSWVDDYARLDSIQQNDVREFMNRINTFYIYVNTHLEIEKVECEKESLYADGTIPSERLLKMIQTKKKYTPYSKYKIRDILLYNVTLEPEHIQDYSQNENYKATSSSFLTPIATTQDIVINPSIFIFHEINGLYFIFQEVELVNHNKQFAPQQPIKSILKNKTLKVEPTTKSESISKKTTKKVRIAIDEDRPDPSNRNIHIIQTRKRRK